MARFLYRISKYINSVTLEIGNMILFTIICDSRMQNNNWIFYSYVMQKLAGIGAYKFMFILFSFQ